MVSPSQLCPCWPEGCPPALFLAVLLAALAGRVAAPSSCRAGSEPRKAMRRARGLTGGLPLRVYCGGLEMAPGQVLGTTALWGHPSKERC